MAIYQFNKEQILPCSLDELWQFIATPNNLNKITPAYMRFEITNGSVPDEMYEGLILKYRVSPIKGYRTTWVTEITTIEPYSYFVDEQRVGPYKIWHHQHHLEEVAGGVKMTDIVSYEPPFGFIGAIANRLFIKQQIQQIFEYRSKELEHLFPTL